jgi:hypothetical protein
MFGCLTIVGLLVVLVIVAAAFGGGGDETAGGGGGNGGGGGGEVAEKPQEKEPANQPQAQQQEQQQEPAQQQGGGQPAESDGGDDVVFRVTGTPGVQFQGSIATVDRQRSVEGVTPQDYPLKDVDTGMFSTDIVSGNAQNMTGGSEKLTVQIVVDGEVVKQSSTKASYGMAQVSWMPSE